MAISLNVLLDKVYRLRDPARQRGLRMDLETRWNKAVAQDAEAAALYAWMAPAHRAAFVEFIRGEAADGLEARIDEALAILSGRALMRN